LLKSKLAPTEIFQRRGEFGIKNTVDMLTEIIESDKKSHRLESIKYLGVLSSSAPSIKKECTEILENVLISDENTEIRCEAAKALGKTRYEKALKPLKWTLKEKTLDNEIKLATLRAIANIRLEDEEINLFIDELGSKQNRVRGLIKNQLIQLEPEKLIKNLAKSLAEDKYSLNHKIEIIRLIGYELSSINISLDDISYIQKTFPEVITHLNKQKIVLVDIVTANLKEEDPEIMDYIIAILKVIGKKIHSEILAKLEHDDFVVKANAITLIGKLKIQEGIPSLVDSLDDMYNEVSKAAIEALGEIGDLSTIPHLLKVLDIEDREFEYIDLDMKWFILDSIKKICINNDKCSIDYFVAKLDTANDILKESIAYLLGEIGDKEYIEPLLVLLNERNMDVKKNTIIALGKIGTSAALEPLIELLDEENTYWLLKKVAIDAIFNIYISNWIESNSHLTRGERILIQNTEKMIDYLNRSETECFKVKVGVIKFLEKFGGKTALAALLRRVNDFHRLVRISATNAIKKIETRLEEELT